MIAEQEHMNRREMGITLLELMIVVSIIAILAAVAITSFTKTTRKAKAAEVPALFSQIKIRQGQYHNENGIYISTGTGDNDYFPSAPAGPENAAAITALPLSWQQLKLQPDQTSLYCAYVTIAGERGDSSNIGAVANSFGFNTAPQEDWFYIIAECDFDDDPADNSLYFMASDSAKLAIQNEGK